MARGRQIVGMVSKARDSLRCVTTLPLDAAKGFQTDYLRTVLLRAVLLRAVLLRTVLLRAVLLRAVILQTLNLKAWPVRGAHLNTCDSEPDVHWGRSNRPFRLDCPIAPAGADAAVASSHLDPVFVQKSPGRWMNLRACHARKGFPRIFDVPPLTIRQ